LIDQRALVAQGASIGKNVSIGAFSIVEQEVEIGDDTWIGSHVVIRSGTKIGSCNKIYQFSSIGEDPQFAAYNGEKTSLIVGNGNVIREYVTLNRGSPAGTGVTQIGDNNFLMAYVHIAHDSRLGDGITFANGASLAGHVEIGDCAILGGFTLVHQFCRVGAHAITGIGTVCLKDTPPFLMVSGNPAKPYGINSKGLRRRGFGEDVVSAIKSGYRCLYRSNNDLQTAIEELQSLGTTQKEVEQLASFVMTSDRGIVR